MGSNEVSRWLNEGDVTAPAEGESINLYGKVAILVSGQATASAGADPISAPALLDMAEASFSADSKVFVRDA